MIPNLEKKGGLEMKYLMRFASTLLLGFVIIAAISGCSPTGEVTGASPVIDPQHSIITLSANAGQWSDVRFTHEAHAGYLNNDCLTCHSHTGVRDVTIWSCSSCHSPGDTENLCLNDNNSHACWMKQCEKCHLTLNPDPTPDCGNCHSAVSTGVFLDGPVRNLFYSTVSKKGFTDASGTFRYEPSETAITFSLGSIVLGTGTPKAVMTPVDLVPGAVDQDDQSVINIARFLQTLDNDAVHGNGITIPLSAYNYISNRTVDFGAPDDAAFASDPGLAAYLSDLNANSVFPTGTRSLQDPAAARNNLFDVIQGFHAPPTAGSVAMTGGLYVTGTVTGTYLYSDPDGDPESGSSYRWLRDADLTPGGETPIAGATSTTYSPGNGDQNNYLIFEVTPADQYHAGSPARSAHTGPVSFNPSNSAPTASNCAVAGPKDINGNLLVNSHFLYTASYTYNDVEGDPESGSLLEWFQDVDTNPSNGNETLVAGGTLLFHPPAASAGSYLFFRVTPRALQGNPQGAACTTVASGPVATDNSVTLYDSLASETQVQKYLFRFSQAGGVVVDVLSYEGWDTSVYYHHYSPCLSCHWDAGGPFDLGFRSGASTNGDSNDILTSNIFLFGAGDVANSATYVLVGSREGFGPGSDAPGVFGTPGIGDDASVVRSAMNPYLDLSGACADTQYANQQTCTQAYCDYTFYKTQLECEDAGYCSNFTYTTRSTCEAAGGTWNTYGYVWHPGSTWIPGSPLAAGDYVLSVGAMILDENGARTGTNGGADNYGWTSIGDRSASTITGNEPNPAYRNYRITITFH